MIISILGSFYWHRFTLFPTSISNYIHYKVWDEINFPIPNLNCTTVEVWEWIRNFIPHFTEHVITYPCWDWIWTISVKGAPLVNTLGLMKHITGQLNGSSLVQLMVCGLLGTKPLPKPIIEPPGINLNEVVVTLQNISFNKIYSKCCLQNGSYFVQTPMH